MAVTGCGCKICKADLGEYTNQLILDGISPKNVLAALENKGTKTTEKLLKKHLAAYQINYPATNDESLIKRQPVKVDLNNIDFSKYNFDSNDIESIIVMNCKQKRFKPQTSQN